MSLSSTKKKQADRVINEAAHLLEAGQPLNYETGQLEVRLGRKEKFLKSSCAAWGSRAGHSVLKAMASSV
jgi:hypothetical protein